MMYVYSDWYYNGKSYKTKHKTTVEDEEVKSTLTKVLEDVAQIINKTTQQIQEVKQQMKGDTTNEKTIDKPKNINADETDTIKAQYGGTHYTVLQIQPWEIIEANGLDFWEGNVIKYVLRYKNKNKAEDLKKARHYLDYLIARESKERK